MARIKVSGAFVPHGENRGNANVPIGNLGGSTLAMQNGGLLFTFGTANGCLHLGNRFCVEVPGYTQETSCQWLERTNRPYLADMVADNWLNLRNEPETTLFDDDDLIDDYPMGHTNQDRVLEFMVGMELEQAPAGTNHNYLYINALQTITPQQNGAHPHVLFEVLAAVTFYDDEFDVKGAIHEIEATNNPALTLAGITADFDINDFQNIPVVWRLNSVKQRI